MADQKENVDLAGIVFRLMADLKKQGDERHKEFTAVMKGAEESHPSFKSKNPLKAREAYFAAYEAVRDYVIEKHPDLHKYFPSQIKKYP